MEPAGPPQNFDKDWIDFNVEQLFPKEHRRRLDMHLAESISMTDLEDANIRSDLRQGIIETLRTELPENLTSVWGRLERDYSKNDEDRAALMTRSAALVKEWNAAWTSKFSDGQFHPAFPEISLSRLQLEGIDFTNAYFTPTENEYLNHFEANLRGSRLNGAFLGEANLSAANLSGASLVRTTLRKASMIKTNLAGADLSYADLRNANLRGANLKNAKLRNADLTGADLRSADLDHADLFGVKGLRLDENPVFRTQFTNRSGLVWGVMAKAFVIIQWVLIRLKIWHEHERENLPHWKDDPWTQLRIAYTGPRFILVFLLVLIFFVPRLLEVSLLAWLGQTQANIVDWAHLDPNMLKARMRPTWEVLLALNKNWASSALVVVLIVYNVLRGMLTLLVTRLRDTEERSWVSPGRVEYMPLFVVHRILRVLSWVAILSASWALLEWLRTPVIIP